MNVAEILAGFKKLRVVVVGDVCLDRWCRYDPALAEVSRETGIPRTAVITGEVTPGAAGTIANNLVALGAGRVEVVGARGDDGHGYELQRALERRGIGTKGLIVTSEIATFTYTKLINCATGVEDVARVDFINCSPLAEGLEREVIAALERAAHDADVMIVSDQAETDAGGVVTPRMREALERIGQRKLVWVDSRRRPEHFRGVILKPNEDEARAALSRIGADSYRDLRARTEARSLFVTHGPEGVLIVDERGERWVHTRGVESPVDICGAGDSFSAGAAMALAVNASPEESARFGNLVASITIMKAGTGTASPDEVLRAAS
jgi:rfaE bifunctional protein kinase chain/domain